MTGGKFSFGAGGYFGSAIEDLLPGLDGTEAGARKLAVAMAIVMDRSGSMACAAGNGVTKMDLADEGAARAVELLSVQDAVAVVCRGTLSPTASCRSPRWEATRRRSAGTSGAV